MALTDGLVSYWRYDNNLNDSSGNGNNLTNSGTMSYITCKDNWLANGALSLTSTPTYTTSASANFQLSDISYSTWVKITPNRAYGEIDPLLQKASIADTSVLYSTNIDNTETPVTGTIAGTGFRFGIGVIGIHNTTNTTKNSLNESDLTQKFSQSNNVVYSRVDPYCLFLETAKTGTGTVRRMIKKTIYVPNESYYNGPLSTDTYTPIAKWINVGFSISVTNLRVRMYVNGEMVQEYQASTLADLCFEASTGTLYQNRFLYATSSSSTSNTIFDEARVYNRELSSSEFLDIYNVDVYSGYTLPNTNCNAPIITNFWKTSYQSEALLGVIVPNFGKYTIHYTTDGSEPTRSSAQIDRFGYIRCTSSCTVKVKLFLESNVYSPTVSKNITVTPFNSLDEGLLARWKLDGGLTDTSPNRYDLTAGAGGVPTYVSDKDGNASKAVYWTADNRIPYNSLSLFNFQTGDETFSFSAWINNNNASVRAFLTKSGAYRFCGASGLNNYITTTAHTDLYTTQVARTGWHHYVYIFNRTNLLIFCDKVLIGSIMTKGALASTANVLNLFQSGITLGTQYIDEIRVFNRPLRIGIDNLAKGSEAGGEILQLFNLGVGAIQLQQPTSTNINYSFDYGTTEYVDFTSSDNAPIYYTLDNSEPTTSSFLYATPIPITNTTDVRAKCIRAGDLDSTTYFATFIRKPKLSNLIITPSQIIPNGSFLDIYITSPNSPVEIYYTTDGSTPDFTKTLYTGSFEIGQSMTIKAIAYKPNWTYSNIVEATYSYPQKLSKVIINPLNTSFTDTLSVSMSQEIVGSEIRYTTDGTDPIITSTLYSSPFIINDSKIIKAKAFKTDYIDSDITTRFYSKTINSITELTESDVEKMQDISSNNYVIEIEKEGNKIILSEFNSNSNLAFFIKQEIIDNKHPLFNNINNRKISMNDCYLELEIPATKYNLELFNVIDFDIDKKGELNIISKDIEPISVNLHPNYKGSDRSFDINMQKCNYTVEFTNNLSYNSTKSIKISIFPIPYIIELDNNQDFIINNSAGGTLPNGTYTYQTQYFNRFSKGNLSPEKSIVSINNSINTINLTYIPNNVEGVILWRKKDNVLQGYYILTKSEIDSMQIVDNGSKVFRSFSGNISTDFTNKMFYYNIMKFGK